MRCDLGNFPPELLLTLPLGGRWGVKLLHDIILGPREVDRRTLTVKSDRFRLNLGTSIYRICELTCINLIWYAV